MKATPTGRREGRGETKDTEKETGDRNRTSWGHSSVGRVLAYREQGPRFDPQCHLSWLWWYIPAIPALEKRKQQDQKFKVILRHIGSSRSTWAT